MLSRASAAPLASCTTAVHPSIALCGCGSRSHTISPAPTASSTPWLTPFVVSRLSLKTGLPYASLKSLVRLFVVRIIVAIAGR